MNARERLQKNLVLLRNCAGWTASDFGRKLGVSRQTVGTFEKNGNKLTVMQYLAIHKVFDDEIDGSEDPEDCMLRILMDSLVDHPDRYPDCVRDEIRINARLFAPSIMKKPQDRSKVSKAWAALLDASGIRYRRDLSPKHTEPLNGDSDSE
ncbi:MAG: helix-turn-helix transcriptional regulator [Clostridia bacterium]|nr:helix-turn-helix transcriptional regulator [Clostridia bacterium]